MSLPTADNLLIGALVVLVVLASVKVFAGVFTFLILLYVLYQVLRRDPKEDRR